MISIDTGERMIPLQALNGARPIALSGAGSRTIENDMARANMNAVAEPGAGSRSARDAFDRVLADARRDQEIHEAAKSLTSQALILPILKELRGGSMAWGPFRDDEATKSFAPLLDQAIADRIASSPQLGVAERLEARLRKRTGEESTP